MPGAIVEDEPIEVAIVGGGIVGLVLAAGLIRQNVKVKLFEQAKGFREIGAGIAFTANAIRCMNIIDPAIVSALRNGGSVATSKDEDDPNDYLRWIDGYNQHKKDDPMWQKMLYKIDAGYKGFEGTRRDQFLENLVKCIPENVVELRKRLDTIEEGEDLDDKVTLRFTDGTVARADAVIATDGIKSRVRQLLFGENNPASHPHYTHKVAYRALIPMDKAVEALGEYKASNQHIHVGPNAHLIHYPVAEGKMINATSFISDPNDWPVDQHTTAQGSRKDLEKAYDGWCLPVRNVISLFPETLEKWAVFDTWDYPLAYYNRGKICLAGDAAHASSPHHGAGACCGVEDVLCLITLVQEIQESMKENASTKGHAIKTAFQVFNNVRRARSQWLVNSSRTVCNMYHQPEWADESRWVKAETCFEEIKDRSLKIWHFDYDQMMHESRQGFRGKIYEPSRLIDSALKMTPIDTAWKETEKPNDSLVAVAAG